jgi:MoaA/NifB/PqqE/SkfB family radical SAM enzyme
MATGNPAYLVLYVTARCNFRCPHCFYLERIENAEKEEELSLSEHEALARAMPHLFHLTVTGGEPFLREDLVEVLEAYRRLSGVPSVSVITNGSLPDRAISAVDAICCRLVGTHLRVSVSLDGFAAGHDEMRGIDGSWERALQTLRGLRGLQREHPRLKVDVTSVYQNRNREDLATLNRFLAAHHLCDNHAVILSRGAPTDDPGVRGELADFLAFSTRVRTRQPFLFQGQDLLKRLKRRVLRHLGSTGELPYVCNAGRSLVEVDETGHVFPCEMLDLFLGASGACAYDDCRLGNLRDVDFDLKRISSSEKARAIRAFVEGGHCACTFDCAIQSNLAFSPLNLSKSLASRP